MNRPAILITGTALQPAVPIGRGLYCIGGTVQRLAMNLSGSAGAIEWSGNLAGQGGYLPGDTALFQVWHRVGLNSTALSNAVSLTFEP